MKRLALILLLFPLIASAQTLSQERLFADAWVEHESLVVARETIRDLNNQIADLQKTIAAQAAEIKALKEVKP